MQRKNRSMLNLDHLKRKFNKTCLWWCRDFHFKITFLQGAVTVFYILTTFFLHSSSKARRVQDLSFFSMSQNLAHFPANGKMRYCCVPFQILLKPSVHGAGECYSGKPLKYLQIEFNSLSLHREWKRAWEGKKNEGNESLQVLESW